MPVIPALRRLKQEDLEFEGYGYGSETICETKKQGEKRERGRERAGGMAQVVRA
jgi:hypothetical protein